MINKIKVCGVEKINAEFENFNLLIDDKRIDINVSRKTQPNLFNFLMNCLRDNKTINLQEIDIK